MTADRYVLPIYYWRDEGPLAWRAETRFTSGEGEERGETMLAASGASKAEAQERIHGMLRQTLGTYAEVVVFRDVELGHRPGWYGPPCRCLDEGGVGNGDQPPPSEPGGVPDGVA